MITVLQTLRKMRISMMISQISKMSTMIMNSLTAMMMTTMIMMMITKTMKMMKTKTTMITEVEAVQDKAVEINRETAREDLVLAVAEVAHEVIPVRGLEAEVREAGLVPDHQAEAGQEAGMELPEGALHQ